MSILEIPSTGTPAYTDLGEMRFVSDRNEKHLEKDGKFSRIKSKNHLRNCGLLELDHSFF